MYRLFILRNNIQTLQSVISHSNNLQNSKAEMNQRICSLCHKLHSLPKAFSRNQSTSTSPSVKPKRQRRKHKSKTFSDVLVVTDQRMIHEKAMVKKLSPSDVKVFATTNLNLSELYKLKSLKKQLYTEDHTYCNLSAINDIPLVPDVQHKLADSMCEVSALNIVANGNDKTSNEKHDGLSKPKDEHDLIHNEIENQEMLQDESSELDILHRTKPLFHPETLEEEHIDQDPQTQPTKHVEIDPTAREEVISRTLSAYIEVCSYLNTPHRGFNALLFHRAQSSKQRQKLFPVIRNTNVYNSVLKGFAAQGNYSKIQEVLKYAKEDDVELNAQSYAAIFECLGRCNIKDNHLKHIRIATKDALMRGLTFDKIMNQAMFLGDQRDMALKAMKSYDPKYQICFTMQNVQYSNPLVNSLNNDRQLEPPNLENDVSKKHAAQTLIKKQLELEKLGSITIKSIEARSPPNKEIIKYREIFTEHVQKWEKDALQGFTRDLLVVTAKRGVLTIEPYLRSIPTKDFIQIIVDEAKKLAQSSETYSPTCNQLYRELGAKVYARYRILRKQKLAVLDKIVDIHTDYCASYTNRDGEMDNQNCFNPRQRWQWVEHMHNAKGATIITDHQAWVPTIIQTIGKFLYQIIIQDLKIDVNAMRTQSTHRNYLPAFYTIFRTENHVMKEEVKPHPILSKLYRASVPETLTFSVTDVPMLCPPVPWCSSVTGGYLVAPCEVVRLPYQATTQRQRIADAPLSTLYPSLDALNQLAAVPWKVNTKILDVILEVFNSGGSSELNVPEPPSSLPAVPPGTPDMSKIQRYQLFRHKMQQKRKKAEMYSLWCDCLYRLSVANHLRDEVFWLPHNMDFRGRVYPIPPHLNHLGFDLARAMLVFAEAKPLGPNGLDWLKLHLINLTGLKKRDCITDRLIFANEVMDKVLDSADYPLTGKKWWTQSEEPWQTLACCMEIAAAHRSDNPEEYLTHFPVHQDGSCNGLQHYAALGRDSAGAHSVNLTPSRLPQDVYNSVVILVEEKRQRDAKAGVAIAQTLEGFIKRKVIKQTIMTTVYGVTRYGARLQIARQLKDIDQFPKEHIFSASNYLTTSTFESLRTMFTSTREIQDWFTDCARSIASSKGAHVEWITPLGLPIVQPYSHYRKFVKNGCYESFQMDKYERPNIMKQKNAFPPNFIHSLDSCHMMLTSLHCERAGVGFVSVHDCYWTHPSSVSVMNKICREQFVALHSEPILENLSLFLTEKYCENDRHDVDSTAAKKLKEVLQNVPNTGNFDINQVLNSVYFFS